MVFALTVYKLISHVCVYGEHKLVFYIKCLLFIMVFTIYLKSTHACSCTYKYPIIIIIVLFTCIFINLSILSIPLLNTYGTGSKRLL